MRGISEERLNELIEMYRFNSSETPLILCELIKECEELNNWNPIDDNTPKDRPVLLLTNCNIVIEGYFVNLDGGYWVDCLYHDEIKPKAWLELPLAPNE